MENMHTDVWVKKKKKTFIYSGYPIQMPQALLLIGALIKIKMV